MTKPKLRPIEDLLNEVRISKEAFQKSKDRDGNFSPTAAERYARALTVLRAREDWLHRFDKTGTEG